MAAVTPGPARRWRAGRDAPPMVLFADPATGIRPTIHGRAVPFGFRLCTLYLGVTPLDRTGRLDGGFAIEVLDPVPSLGHDGAAHDVATRDGATCDGATRDGTEDDRAVEDGSAHAATGAADERLHALCDERATRIVARARAEGRGIRLLWSGGIDSTAAACALLGAIDPAVDRLTFFHGPRSRGEHPRFFDEVVRRHPRVRIRSVARALDEHDLLVTGEHGDQLFGSAKALSLPWPELTAAWPDALARDLHRQLASSARAEAAMRCLAPQIEASPVPIVTLWDALWWLSFSLKWQGVTLRIPARTPPRGLRRVRDVSGQLARTEHFFRDEALQRWAMTHRDAAIRPGDWTSYKRPLKAYIHRFDGDADYLRTKRKEPSLGHVLTRRPRRAAVTVGATGETFLEPPDTSLRQPVPLDGGSTGVELEVGFEPSRENGLWEAFDTDGE